MEERLTRIEKFLDKVEPDWKNPEFARYRERPQGARLPASLAGNTQEAKELHVDEEQTNKDREALGLDKTDFAGKPVTGDAAVQEARNLDEETRREQERAKAEHDLAASEKGPIKAADQYANPPGGAMKQPEGDAPAPLAAPPGAAGGGKPPVEQTGQAG